MNDKPLILMTDGEIIEEKIGNSLRARVRREIVHGIGRIREQEAGSHPIDSTTVAMKELTLAGEIIEMVKAELPKVEIKPVKLGVDRPCSLHKGPAGDCNKGNCTCY